MTDSDRKRIALEYWDAGFNPIPAFTPLPGGKCECRKPDCKSPGKHPRIQWKIYIDRRPERSEVEEWWTRFPHANIQLMTGQGLAVLDIDPRNGGAESLRDLLQKFGDMPLTVKSNTGGGGNHYFFRYDEDEEPDSVELAPGVEIKARAHAVMVPPSSHASGNVYEWAVDVDPALDNCAHMPDWFHLARPVNEKGVPQKNAEGWIDELLKGTSEGQRHNAAAKLAGYWLAQGNSPLDVLRQLKLWDTKNTPPLGDDHLRDLVRDLAAKEAEQRSTRQNFTIEGIDKYNYPDSPLYFVQIFGERVRLTSAELFQWAQFVLRVGEKADRVPHLKDATKVWKPMLDELMRTRMTTHEVPIEASRDEGLWMQICLVLHGRAREDEVGLLGQGLYSNEDFYYVQPAKLAKIVQERGSAYQRLEPSELWETLRHRGADTEEKTVNDQGVDTILSTWKIPKAWVLSTLPRKVRKAQEENPSN